MPRASAIKTDIASKHKQISTVIVGWNPIARTSFDKIQSQSYYDVVGFVYLEPIDGGIRDYKGVPVLGSIANFDNIIRQYNIRYSIIALDPQDYKLLHQVIRLCKKHRLQYNIVSDFYDVVYGRTIEHVFKEIQRPIEVSIRRFFDIILSSLGLIIILPIWLLVAIAIKLDSRGTVLFSQERVGKEGKIFRIFKFRTMVSDAESKTGPVLADRDDPRITKVGKFLRKTRIDEIPQLLNVLIGDMSIVGPRPERPYFVEKYSREIPMYKNRLRMKPGITGLAQITIGYDTSIEDVRNKLKYDLQYLDSSNSLSLNFKILLKTVWVVLTGKGH